MSILIKGMEMPTQCAKCRLSTVHGFQERPLCDVLVKYMSYGEWETKRLDDCPLVFVPEHGRLGDLDKLEQMFVDIDNAPYSGFDGSEPFYSAEDAAQIIRLSPTIIPAEEVDTHDNC